MSRRRILPAAAIVALSLLGTIGISTAFAAPLTALPEGKQYLKQTLIKFAFDAYASNVRFKTIEGKGKSAAGEFDPQTRRLKLKVFLQDWNTDNRSRDRDMHAEVLKSNQYPHADFDGRLTDFNQSTGAVTVVGTFRFRGKTVENWKLVGRAESRADGMLVRTSFDIKLSDFDIKAPRNAYVFRVGDAVRVKAAFVFSGESN